MIKDLYSRLPYPKTVAAAAVLYVVYALLGFFLAPGLIGQAITGFADTRLQRKAAVGTVHVNPLLFKVELSDFALAERDGAPIVGFKRLLVDFELSSLARFAWTFSEIALEGLDVKADIAPGGRFNLAALLDSLPKGEPGGAPPRLLLQHVVLREGHIAFSDRSDPTPASTTVGPINLELKDLSTRAGDRGAYRVSARLREGGTLNWRGEISLAPISSQGEIEIKGVRPLTAWRFLQDELGVTAPRGEMDLGARYRVAYADGTPQATVENLRVDGRDIELTATGAKQPMLRLTSLGVAGGGSMSPRASS